MAAEEPSGNQDSNSCTEVMDRAEKKVNLMGRGGRDREILKMQWVWPSRAPSSEKLMRWVRPHPIRWNVDASGRAAAYRVRHCWGRNPGWPTSAGP